MDYLEVTPSYINDIMLCARLYYYNRVRNLQGLGGNSMKIDRGTFMHWMLEVYYAGLLENYKGRDPMWSPEQLVEKAIEESRPKALLPEMNLSPNDIAETEYQFREYVNYYRADGLTPIAVEEPFSKELFKSEELNVTVIISGRIDLIASQSREPDRAIIFDHKTKDKRSDPHVLSNQAFGYCWATGIRNFCLNVVGFQKTLARNERFKRHVWMYNPTQIQEWEGIATFWCKLILGYEREQIFPPNFTSCDKFAYVGGGGCRFREICATLPEAREYKLTTQFVEGAAHDPYQR